MSLLRCMKGMAQWKGRRTEGGKEDADDTPQRAISPRPLAGAVSVFLDNYLITTFFAR
jgi:hypothetical protein